MFLSLLGSTARVGAIALLGVGGGVWLGLSESSPLVTELAKERAEFNRAQYGPKMKLLADAGHPDAIIWVANHYPADDIHPLTMLAESGNREALFDLSKRYESDAPLKARQLLQRSADAGYFKAVAVLHPPQMRDLDTLNRARLSNLK